MRQEIDRALNAIVVEHQQQQLVQLKIAHQLRHLYLVATCRVDDANATQLESMQRVSAAGDETQCDARRPQHELWRITT